MKKFDKYMLRKLILALYDEKDSFRKAVILKMISEEIDKIK